MFHNIVKVLQDVRKLQQQPAGMILNCSLFIVSNASVTATFK